MILRNSDYPRRRRGICIPGKPTPGVVNRLLENNNFLKVTVLIAQFLNDELAAGIAAQNQLYSTVSAFLAHSPEAAKTVSGLKVPTYQAELTMIQNTFMTAVKEIKKKSVPMSLERRNLRSLMPNVCLKS